LIADKSKLKKYIEKLKKDMKVAASNLEFEEAGKIRDQIHELENAEIELS
jgi:excinuclease ABC subunit B